MFCETCKATTLALLPFKVGDTVLVQNLRGCYGEPMTVIEISFTENAVLVSSRSRRGFVNTSYADEVQPLTRYNEWQRKMHPAYHSPYLNQEES